MLFDKQLQRASGRRVDAHGQLSRAHLVDLAIGSHLCMEQREAHIRILTYYKGLFKGHFHLSADVIAKKGWCEVKVEKKEEEKGGEGGGGNQCEVGGEHA